MWELKVAMHQALLDPKRASDLLDPFIGTGVRAWGVYVRGERERQKDQPVFSRGTWADLGSDDGPRRKSRPVRELVIGAPGCGWGRWCPGLVLWSDGVRTRDDEHPQAEAEKLQPKVKQVTEREEPAETHIERVMPSIEKKDAATPPPVVAAVPEKPSKVPESPQRPGLVWIAPGTFMMGSTDKTKDPDHQEDETRHAVQLTKSYYLMQTEVTQGQYRAVMGEKSGGDPARNLRENGNARRMEWGQRLPVYCVDFYDAVKYAERAVGERGAREVLRGKRRESELAEKARV